jgi:hypothetical protein
MNDRGSELHFNRRAQLLGSRDSICFYVPCHLAKCFNNQLWLIEMDPMRTFFSHAMFSLQRMGGDSLMLGQAHALLVRTGDHPDGDVRGNLKA